ncbi:MAG: carbonic anhydrase [Candidatus Micrarchaeia archaeon]
MAGLTIFVSCMDRRLNKYLEKEQDGRNLFVRNAGGNVLGLEQTLGFLIENFNVTGIKVVAHTDCGAMGYVYNAVKKGENGIHKQLVEEFANEKFADRLELEKLNETIQKELAQKLFGNKGISISSELIALNEPSENGKAHVAVVTKVSVRKYSEIAKLMNLDEEDCYFLQANSITELLPDLALATGKLGIKDVRLAALDSTQYRQVNADFEMLKTRGFADKAKITVVRL